MKYPLEFTKASGAGNDFVIIDDMLGGLKVDKPRLAVALCSRHFGIGADGLIVIEPSNQADFVMSYYNADGSYGGMCANGGRCAARFAFLAHIAGPEPSFEALDHIYQAEVTEDTVRLHMKDPTGLRTNIRLEFGNTLFVGTAIDTGSPHVVFLSDNIQSLDLARLGPLIRYSKEFLPDGTNVNFARRTTDNEIELRTYERGVEAETLACGTGSVASALVSHLLYGINSPIMVRVQSGEILRVHFNHDGNILTKIMLEGSAHILFKGQVEYDSISNSISR
jgi:diaminopimelate epimerase